jgi:hypothetical protein
MPSVFGSLDPLDRVDVDREIPRVHSAGSTPRSSAIQPGDHQPLDVVRVAERSVWPMASRRQRSVGVARSSRTRAAARARRGVVDRAARHRQPVQAAHVFAPAEDLPDEAFDRGDRRAPARYGVDRRGDTRRAASSFRFIAADRREW